jgi:hypothetical protein
MAAGPQQGRPGYSNPNPQYGAAVRDLTSNINTPSPGGLLTLDPSGPMTSAPLQPPQGAGLLGMPQPTFDAGPSLLSPTPTPNYADPGAGLLPPPQSLAPPVYTDKAIGSDGPLMMAPKAPPQSAPLQVAPMQNAPLQHPTMPPPQPSAAPDSASPLAGSMNTDQQALAAAQARIRAAIQQANGGYPSSLFRRGGNPMGVYQ